MTNKKEKTDLPDFESSLQELEAIVNKMASGECSLEQSLKEFEQGIALARKCQTALQQAEQRINQLIANNEPE